MTTGMAWRHVSNMVIIKNKVTSGVAWRPISQTVLSKGVFDCLESARIVANVNEAIRQF